MPQKPETPKPTADDEDVVIRLDLKGLAALMHAIETALQTGRGVLLSGSGVGLTYGTRSLGQVTVKMAPPDDEADARPDPLVPAELEPA